ncbi:MAG: glycosyltransferase, partial [Bacteroidota bacterium]
LQGIEHEIFVVDNNSTDQSVSMLQSDYSDLHLILNKENLGFSKANNQAIRRASGEYIMLLNPDTVVGEDSMSKVVQFMDQTKDCGALGVRMIDGSGKFLPESKRGLPTPTTAFFKMTGLSSLFPKSRIFNQYHLGFLDEHKVHEVEVLSGACMCLRKSVLDEIGLLDETFFMYGEDIDLSYRVIKAGYKNYYFPDTTIIHYKGESTKKGSLNYVKVFYNAMIIFAKKHFTGGKAGVYIFAIQLAIFAKALLSFFKNLFQSTYLLLIDGFAIYFGLHFIKQFWARYQFNDPSYYENSNMHILIPVYTFIWILSIFFGTGYDKEIKFWKLFRSISLGTIFLLAIYGLLPDTFRSSRAIILIGFVTAISISFAIRIIRNVVKNGQFIGNSKVKNVLIIGSENESRRALDLLNLAKVKFNYCGTLSI